MLPRVRSIIRDFVDMAGAIMHEWRLLALGILAGGVVTAYDRTHDAALDIRVLEVPLILALVAAFFLAWRKKNETLKAAVDHLSEARDVHTPRFEAEITMVMIPAQSSVPPLHFALAVVIANIGADSAARAFRLSLRASDGRELPAEVYAPETGLTLGFDDGKSVTYNDEDFIYNRTRQVVRRGEIQDGILPCRVGATDRLGVDFASLKFSFVDAAGTRWWSDEMEPGEVQGTMSYVSPGLPYAR